MCRCKIKLPMFSLLLVLCSPINSVSQHRTKGKCLANKMPVNTGGKKLNSGAI